MRILVTCLLAFTYFTSSAQHCEHHCHAADEHDMEHTPVQHTAYKNSRYKTQGLTHFIGTTHQHSGYSDGWPGTTPRDYFQSGIDNGFDFVFGADHSDSYLIPMTLNEECLGERIVECVTLNPTNLQESLVKWLEFRDIVQEYTDSNFLAVRGFEWTSDRFGHINVYFSQNITNAKTDGGYVVMDLFWNWLTAEPINLFGLEGVLGGFGAADAIAVFNHPGDKDLFDGDPGFNWNSFEYVPEADSQMVGIEVFNDGREYGANGRTYYQEALDAGWHVGAIASEDHHGENWNNEEDEKTIIVSESLDAASIQAAMKNRSTYAVRDFGLRMDFFAGEEFMGSRIARKTDSQVRLTANVTTSNDAFIELVSNGNEILTTTKGANLNHIVDVVEEERWYYLRVVNRADSSTLAYSSPIWIAGGGDTADNVTSVTEAFFNSTLQAFPNPVAAGEEVHVHLPDGTALAQAQLRNTLGQVVAAPSYASKDELHFDTSNLNSGIYFITLNNEAGAQKSIRLVVQ